MNARLLAMADQEEDQPRLYSRQPRIPIDTIFPQHQGVHLVLDRWGWWNREKYEPSTCASMEKDYLKGGSEAVPPSTAPQPTDPAILGVDQTVRLMRRRVPQHAQTLALYYVDLMEPRIICKVIVVHRNDWPRWMGHCRAMVRNILLELDI